jgi:hypothetical protein
MLWVLQPSRKAVAKAWSRGGFSHLRWFLRNRAKALALLQVNYKINGLSTVYQDENNGGKTSKKEDNDWQKNSVKRTSQQVLEGWRDTEGPSKLLL